MMSLFEALEKKSEDSKYHLGRLFFDCMVRKPPDDVCQIDAATGEQETTGSVLSRSVRLARAFRAFGLQPGDVLALGGRNHLDLHIPYYAALLNGLPVVGVDPFYKYDEIKQILKLTEPKIAFCQQETYDDFSRAAADLGLDVKIITFDGSEDTLNSFIETYGGKEPIDNFEPADFDTDKVYAWLVSTSGTTGLPKVAAFKHRPLIKQMLAFGKMGNFAGNTENKIKLAMNLSPVQWISSYFNAVGMLVLNNCKLQTSKPSSIEHLIDIINEYKPVTLFTSPSVISLILKNDKECDLTCFNAITVTGSKVYKDMLVKLKSRLRPNAIVIEGYGQTETMGPVLWSNPRVPIGSCGVAMPGVKVKLVDPDTDKEITEPNVTGEIWIKGPCFEEYYNNPEETAKAYTEDGWFKTGDLLYRDENNNYYFVDRLKMLMKFRSYHINPPELEEVIMTHEGVQEVAVTGIPHADDGQLAVAVVIRRPGYDVTAQEIKDLVAGKLSDSKRLRGGVVFVEELPKTSTGKVVRATLNKIVQNAHRE